MRLNIRVIIDVFPRMRIHSNTDCGVLPLLCHCVGTTLKAEIPADPPARQPSHPFPDIHPGDAFVPPSKAKCAPARQ